MARLSQTAGRAAAIPLLCGVLFAGPANAQPLTPLPTSPASPDDIQKLFGLLSKGYSPADCHPQDPEGNQLVEIDCDINSDSGGPISARYALYRDAGSLQSAFSSAIAEDELVACPGINKSPGEWHFQGSPDQTAGSIACGYLDTLSQVVWTNDANLMLGATESLDDVPRHFQWWLAEG
jgi:hypothetical protein